MAQHFLMSAAARTLSLIDLCDLSEDAAHKMLCKMRWEDTNGDPVCPYCGCPAVYTYRCRRVFKCKACHRQFSATSGTLLAHRKIAFRTLLMAFCLFVNAAKGLSSLQLSRNLGLHAKTAFVLLHKLRCALTSTSATTIWREDMRRKATGAQFNACGRSVLGHPPSRRWVGYWRRHLQKEELRQAA